jgi:4-hydroxy-tetrahydrodipicolinate synthase
MLAGCTTALITPFKNGRLDVKGLRSNVRFQVESGVAGVLVCGSTGEAAALSPREWELAVSVVIEEAKGKVKVVVGAGTNSTRKSIDAVRLARRLGADSVLVVAPYYVKPSQEGIYRHYRAVSEAVSIPLVVYNIPGRSMVNIEPATIERLAADCPRIVAAKEASGNIDQATEIIVRCGDRLTVLSGDDSLTLPILSVGGKGVVSVAGNIVPDAVCTLIARHMVGAIDEAAAIHRRLYPLIKALFIETNPVPVKAAMDMLGMAAGEPRLPLCGPTSSNRKHIRAALRAFGLKPEDR